MKSIFANTGKSHMDLGDEKEPKDIEESLSIVFDRTIVDVKAVL